MKVVLGPGKKQYPNDVSSMFLKDWNHYGVLPMLFHRDIGLPKRFFPQGIFNLVYSEHAKSAAYHDRYAGHKGIQLPQEIMARDDRLIETEIVGKDIVKLVYRIPYSSEYDLTLAISVQRGRAWMVKTVWLNSVNDIHNTLNRAAYTIPA